MVGGCGLNFFLAQGKVQWRVSMDVRWGIFDYLNDY
jgi:hypothetical protein